MFEKIKRLSATYRKHEKEILEIKLKQLLAYIQLVSVLQTIHIENSCKNGGIIPNQKTGEIVFPPTEKIPSKIKLSNGKINIICDPDSLNNIIKKQKDS